MRRDPASVAAGPATWGPRDRPLSPVGAVGFGPVARALAARLLQAEALPWRAAADRDCLLVVGDEIPWVSGLIWLGRDPRAPELLLPTTAEPPVHPALLAARLGPVALTLDPPAAIPLRALGSLDRDVLVRWWEAG